MLDWRTLSKDIEEILISDEWNQNENNDEDSESDWSIHSKSRRIKEGFNWKGNLQNFKKYLIYIHKTLRILLLD